MNNSPAEIIRGLLTGSSGSYFTDPDSHLAWPLFVAALPDQPDNAGCLYDTAGVIQTRLLASGYYVQTYGLQLKVRGLKYSGNSGVYPLISVVRDFMRAVNRTPVIVGTNSYKVDTVNLSSPVASLGQDEKRRAMCSVNFLVHLIDL